MGIPAFRRMAAWVVVGLVITSFPARVWLFGACPICGQFHDKIFVAQLGGDPTPDTDPSDDPPGDDHAMDGCFPPLPYCSTASAVPIAVSLTAGDELRLQSDPELISIPASALIRPPRA
jgi:hypothetical protein